MTKMNYSKEDEHVDQNINNEWLESASLELYVVYQQGNLGSALPQIMSVISPSLFAWAPGVVCLVAAHHVPSSLQNIGNSLGVICECLPGILSSLGRGRNLSPFCACCLLRHLSNQRPHVGNHPVFQPDPQSCNVTQKFLVCIFNIFYTQMFLLLK